MYGRHSGLFLALLLPGLMAAELPPATESQALDLITQAHRDRNDGYFYRSEAEYRHAMDLIESASGSQSPNLTPVLNGLAELYFDARRYTEAEALSRRSATLVETALGAEHPLLATALHDLAAIYHVQGQYDKAAPLYQRALAIRRAALGPDHPFVAATLFDLANMELVQGRSAQAAAHFARAVEIQQNAFGENDPRVARTLAAYASALCKSGHRHAAVTAQNRSRAILARAAFSAPGADLRAAQ
jgi:tetratricopeptide (TPR) repeat protein